MDFLKPVLESGRIDFAGQQLATKLSTTLLVGSGILAFIIGFVTQRLSYSFLAYAFGVLVTYFIALFPWPYYKRNPVVWLSRTKQAGHKKVGAGGGDEMVERKTVVEDVSDDDE